MGADAPSPMPRGTTSHDSARAGEGDLSYTEFSHAVCGDAVSSEHAAVADAAEALRKRVVSLDATAARNAEFLDTLIATCHLDRDARARKGLVQRTIDAAVVAPPPPEAPPPEAAAAGE